MVCGLQLERGWLLWDEYRAFPAHLKAVRDLLQPEWTTVMSYLSADRHCRQHSAKAKTWQVSPSSWAPGCCCSFSAGPWLACEATLSVSRGSSSSLCVCCVCTCTEHTTAVSAVGGEACETKSIHDCRCLEIEEAESCDVIVLTGEESEPLASLGTAAEYGGGRVPLKKGKIMVKKSLQLLPVKIWIWRQSK